MSDLLKQVERRWVDRRQVLRRLGLGAAGALAATAAHGRYGLLAAGTAQAVPTGPGKAFPVTTLNHVRYEVTDYAKTRDWYVDLLGMRIAWDNGSQCALEFGAGKTPEGLYLRNVAPGVKPNIDHFGFGTPNITPNLPAMKIELQRWGVTGIQPDGGNGWSSDDPAGFPLNPFVSEEKDEAMFPGAAPLCADIASDKCKAGYAAGLKGLDRLPKPSGTGFKVTSFSHVVLNVPQAKIQVEKEFYRDLLGMKVIYDQPDQVYLRYGKNGHVIQAIKGPGTKAYSNQVGFEIENYDQGKVEAQLKARGLNPKPYTKLAWTIADPDGMRIEVAGAGLLEHLANNCKGSADACR